MPLLKLQFQPGINRDISPYANESGWVDGDKVRFRMGFPEKIGGWRRISSNFFQGVCRSLFVWNNNGGAEFTSVGTNLKFYIEFGGQYFDITPIRRTTSAGVITFFAVAGSTTVRVLDPGHGAIVTDFVTFSGATGLGGNVTANVLNREYQITRVADDDIYEIELSVPANSLDTGTGGAAAVAEYQVNTGPETSVAVSGWGAGPWSGGAWGASLISFDRLRLWHQDNFGEDLFFGPSGGGLYYWDATNSTTSRGIAVADLPGASDVPLMQNFLFVSDLFRFAFVFGTNPIGESELDATLIRWSDQEDIANWTPSATNQAGSLRLSRGSEIVTAIQSRQEILVFTDIALYSLQFLGAPAVWGAQLVGTAITIVGPNAVAFSNGIAFWMGKDTFFMYDGRVQPIECPLLGYIFDDINREEFRQVFAGVVSKFNEIWWFYCSSDSTTVDKYVIFNFVDNTWAHGTLARTAWRDSGLLNFPIGATYEGNIVEHENGVDDNTLGVEEPIEAFVQSGDLDLDDGDRIMFGWRCIPDMHFAGSMSTDATAELTLIPKYAPGGALNDPASVGGISGGPIARTAVHPVDRYTTQIDTRIRGRHVALKVSSNSIGTQWKLGLPRLDIRPDGRR